MNAFVVQNFAKFAKRLTLIQLHQITRTKQFFDRFLKSKNTNETFAFNQTYFFMSP